jgi:hypothetical protein
MAVIAVLVLALGAFLAAVETNRAKGMRRVVLGLGAGLIAVAAVAPVAGPWRSEAFRATTEAYGCIGSAPAVCGPRSRLPLLRPVQTSLARSYLSLAGTDFVRPMAFRVTRYDHYAELGGAAPLEFNPEEIHNGRYSNVALAGALLRPHQCTELFSSLAGGPLMEAQDRIRPWLLQVLARETAAVPVPAEVSSAFELIEHCRPMTWNLR